MDLRIINIKEDGVFTVKDEDGRIANVQLFIRQVHPTIPGVSLLCSPIEVEVSEDEGK